MSSSAGGGSPLGPLATLRRYLQPPVQLERCELCSGSLPPDHLHLVEPARRGLLCTCEACAILFGHHEGARYRRVPRRLDLLVDFRMTDIAWAGLELPVDLAFFLQSTPAGRIVAVYPSPGGATESLVALPAWTAVVEDNPILSRLEPDVEALLAHRVGEVREYFLLGIDECYRLVGLLRLHWRGFSGGDKVWEEIASFFSALRRRCRVVGESTRA